MTPAEHKARAEECLANANRVMGTVLEVNGSLASPQVVAIVGTFSGLAQVHATLAAAQAGPELVDAGILHAAEIDLENAKERKRDLERFVDNLRERLNEYGQDFAGYELEDIAERVSELMRLIYNDDREPPTKNGLRSV